jgi:hypothetical protein
MKRALHSPLPFSNAHWTLPVILWLLSAYFFFAPQCSEGPRYAAVAMLTATICIALWTSHIRESPTENWKSIAKILAGALYDLLLMLIWLVPIALFVPAYDCYTPRSKIMELFSLSTPLVTEIERVSKQHDTLSDSGVGIKVMPGKYLSGGIVSRDGTIVEISKNPPAVIMLVPEFSVGSVTWKCTGFPKEYMPVDCRD